LSKCQKMTYRLFLDDIRDPPDDTWVIARSFDEAVNIVLTNGFPCIVSFDHDLGDNSKTGKDFANWLVERDLDTAAMSDTFSFTVHSANPPGAANICSILTNYLKFKLTNC
jgi:hypothetical protein